MKNALHRALTGLLILTALGTGAPAQDAVEDPIVALDELVLRYYTPRDVDRDELLAVAGELFGSRVQVRGPHGDYLVERFLQLEHSFIIRDTAARADEIARALAEIEDELYPSEEEPATQQESGLESLEYAPRFLSTESVMRGLQGFSRKLLLPPPPGGGSHTQTDNVIPFEDRNLILIRETPEQIAAMRALLAQIDVPVPQATFSIMVIRGRKTGAADGGQGALPAELVQHLKQMVPVQGFDLLATGVLRSSTRDPLRIETRADDSTQYELFLEPSAFDRESGELTLRRCRFQAVTLVRTTGPEAKETRESQSFETALSLRNGEYTVLGSVGPDPLFVVLRMEL